MLLFFFFNDTATTEIYTLSLHDALPIYRLGGPDLAAQWTAALTAPLVEETLKAVGVVLIYLIARSELNGVVDGFVYGAMVGLGFAVVENVFYFVGQFGGQPAGVIGGFFIRVLASGLYGHVLYTGLTGMGIAWFVTRTDQSLARRLLVAGGLCLLAVLAHFLWNSPLLNLLPTGEVTPVEQLVAIPLAAAVKGVPFLVLVVLLVGLARRQERRWLQAAAAGELGGPALLPEELEVLERPGRRWRARRALRRRSGRRAALLLKRLHRQQLSLAMLRTRLTDEDAPDRSASASGSPRPAKPCARRSLDPPARPLPVTRPSRAVASWTPTASGRVASVVHNSPKPNAAPT